MIAIKNALRGHVTCAAILPRPNAHGANAVNYELGTDIDSGCRLNLLVIMNNV